MFSTEHKYRVRTKTIAFDFTNGVDKYDVIKKVLDGLEIGVLGK